MEDTRVETANERKISSYRKNVSEFNTYMKIMKTPEQKGGQCLSHKEKIQYKKSDKTALASALGN